MKLMVEIKKNPNHEAGFTPLEVSRQRRLPFRFQRNGLLTGFTMFEVAIVVGIVTLISATVLVSFTGLNQGAELNRYARELALSIRKAQNMSLTVKEILVGSPPALQIAPSLGIKLDLNQPSFFLFGDLDPDLNNSPPDQDGKWSGTWETIPQTEGKFTQGIVISKFSDQTGAILQKCSSLTAVKTLHILFDAPEAVVRLRDDDGCLLATAQKVDIQLQAPNGQTRKISVWTSGQVSIN